MSIDVRWVPLAAAGSGDGGGCAAALAASLAACKGDDPLRAVTVVVPSNQVGVATRRLLASGAAGPVATRGVGLAGVTFVTPFRLAEQLGAPALAASGRRPVSAPVIAAALRHVLADRPGVFAPVAAHPATESALVATYRELREAVPTELDALAATGRRAAEVVRLHRAAHALLVDDWYDEQDLMVAASDVARRGTAGPGDHVIVYLPQRTTPHTVGLLRALGGVGTVSVLAGWSGHAGADAEVVESVTAIVGGPPPAPPAPHPLPVSVERTTVVSVSDPDDEVRTAVRCVVDAARSGTPLDRIAVLYAAPVPYLRLAHEHLGAAGIAVNGPSVLPLSARIAGRVLLDGFALAQRDVRRDELFAWLSSAPVRVEGRPAPVSTWERISRAAGVVGGDDWTVRLRRWSEERETEAAAWEADPVARPDRARHARADAREARRLSTFVTGLRAELAPERGTVRTWRAHADWALGFLDATLGPAEAWTGPGAWADAATRRAERRAAERVHRAIERLATLDDVEGPVGLDVFARTVAIELDGDLGRTGRFGDGVLVGPVGFALGLDLDLVVVLGLAEGTFPAPVRDDSLLPDEERAAAGRALGPRTARVERQHRELRAALAAGRRHHLSLPRGDLRRNAERTPSRWLLDALTELRGAPVWSDDLEELAADPAAPWFQTVASFDDGLRRLHEPATDQEYRLRTLLADGGDAPAGLRSTDGVVATGVSAVVSRRSDDFTRFDGNAAGVAIPSPVDGVVSASRMETWARCPFAYFVGYVLGVMETENPEDADQISPRDTGTLVHEVLERFVGELLERPQAQRPTGAQPWSATERSRLRAIAEEVCDRFHAEGRTGRELYWRRDRLRILATLDRFLELDQTHRAATGTVTVAAELAFGPATAIGPVTLPLADGRGLAFRGMADRVDVAADGSVHVIDYKTGKPDPYRDLSADQPDGRGTRLQLPVYAAAARLAHGNDEVDVHAGYWFAGTIGGTRRIGYTVTDDVSVRVAATLGAIVDGIEAGVFAPHPRVGSSHPWVDCPACDPDALGTVELRRAFDRKRHDSALAAYVALAEPEGDTDDTEAEGVAS